MGVYDQYAAGEATQVQFNDGIYVAGDPGLTYAKAKAALNASVRQPVQRFTSAGAVVIKTSSVFIAGGSATALTLADPGLDDDGTTIAFIAETAQTHSVSNAAGSGFNGGGASKDVATFSAAIGNGFTVVAQNGKWWQLGPLTGVTLG